MIKALEFSERAHTQCCWYTFESRPVHREPRFMLKSHQILLLSVDSKCNHPVPKLQAKLWKEMKWGKKLKKQKRHFLFAYFAVFIFMLGENGWHWRSLLRIYSIPSEWDWKFIVLSPSSTSMSVFKMFAFEGLKFLV
jgi:hypothetical protein